MWKQKKPESALPQDYLIHNMLRLLAVHIGRVNQSDNQRRTIHCLNNARIVVKRAMEKVLPPASVKLSAQHMDTPAHYAIVIITWNMFAEVKITIRPRAMTFTLVAPSHPNLHCSVKCPSALITMYMMNSLTHGSSNILNPIHLSM